MAYTENPILEGKDFESIAHDVNENFDIINNEINSRNEVIFGYYIGNYVPAADSKYYSSTRIIDLGFTPSCVELWAANNTFLCYRYDGTAESYNIGIATRNNPAYGLYGTMFEIVENGLKVIESKDYREIPKTWTRCNYYGVKYLFKAYKDTIPSMGIKEYK